MVQGGERDVGQEITPWDVKGAVVKGVQVGLLSLSPNSDWVSFFLLRRGWREGGREGGRKGGWGKGERGGGVGGV